MNHFLILSGHKVYTFGDEDVGALGCVFKKKISRVDFFNPACINLKNIERIFTTDFSSFVVRKTRKNKQGKRFKIYAFGLNNYHQLGFESEDRNEGVEKLPYEWT